MSKRILVTGVSGYLGGHLALRLLDAGFVVRGSVRSLAKGQQVRDTLTRSGADVSRLELVELDLLADDGWADAATGCDVVMHTASPFVTKLPKNPATLVRPAIDGTRRAVGAALEAGADRIVVTSSAAAIINGHADTGRVFTEDDWTDLSGPLVSSYARSKTLAERMAWSLVLAAGRRDALTVVNPGMIAGRLLDTDPGTSGGVIVRLLSGGVPLAPPIGLEWVDVDDVVAVHLAAVTRDGVGGRRFIVSEEYLTLLEISRLLAAALPEYRAKLPRRGMPQWLVTIAGRMDRSLRDSVPEMAPPKRTDASAAESLLGRPLRPAREAVVAMAKSAVARGII